MLSSQIEKEGPEAISISISDYQTECDEKVRKERIKTLNKKLKHIESESLIFSCLKGCLLWRHKNALGHKDFITFWGKTDERYDYVLFLIKLYKLFGLYAKCRFQ